MKLKSLVAAVAIGLGTAAMPSFGAALVNQVLDTGLSPNEFQDTDLERVLRNGQSITTGNFQVGDIIQTILRFDTVNNQTISDLFVGNGGPLPNYYQLTAVAELRVASITNCTGGAASQCLLTFDTSGNLGANVFANVYERDVNLGAANTFSQAAAPNTAVSQIQAQTLIAQVGIGEADDFWNATSLLDIGLAAAVLTAGSPQAANGVFGLSVLSNPGAIPFSPNAIVGDDGNLHTVVGNASAYQRAPGANAGWLFSSNTTVDFNLVPEPGSLALVGLALAGLGIVSRRRDSVKS